MCYSPIPYEHRLHVRSLLPVRPKRKQSLIDFTSLLSSLRQPVSQSTAVLWKATLEIATKLLEFLDLDDNVALASQSFSFAQVLILTFTLDKLRNDHIFIQADKLRAEAVKVAERLVQKLQTQTYD